MSGEIAGGWGSVAAAYTITAVVLLAQGWRLWRAGREDAKPR